MPRAGKEIAAEHIVKGIQQEGRSEEGARMNPALRVAAPLAARSLRALALRDDAGLDPLSAASSLVAVGRQLYVVADDEHHLAVFDRGDPTSGTLLRLFEDELPPLHRDRKRAKPDLESLLQLPASQAHPHGGLLALGSGSRPQRRRGIVLDFDGESGLPVGLNRCHSLSPQGRGSPLNPRAPATPCRDIRRSRCGAGLRVRSGRAG